MFEVQVEANELADGWGDAIWHEAFRFHQVKFNSKHYIYELIAYLTFFKVDTSASCTAWRRA